MATAEQVVRKYLSALKDPQSLIDEDAITSTEEELSNASDPIERLRLQQRLNELRQPSVSALEDDFVVHAKAWAEEHEIGVTAFEAEGVPSATLRRAGFGGKRGRRANSGGRRNSGKRVTTEEVIAAIPRGSFTVKSLQEISGASPAVVRKAIKAEQEEGHVVEEGPDPDHSGPGRAATLYRKG